MTSGLDAFSMNRPPLNIHTHRNSFSHHTFAPANPYRPGGAAGTPLQKSVVDLPWPVLALDWHTSGRIAIGSFCDDGYNRIGMLHYEDEQLSKAADIETPLPFPVTQVQLEPPRSGGGSTSSSSNGNLVASVGDYLRVYSIDTSPSNRRLGVVRQEAILGNTKQDFPAPLTALSWNRTDPSIIATASVDTTCTIWDLATQQARTQLIAHDKEVFDLDFIAGSVDVFSSVGADGSVRLFDLRALEHSTIIYEATAPLLRLATCPLDANLLATFDAGGTVVHILDVRRPGAPLLELDAHSGPLNAIDWSPTAKYLATAADDAQVLIWDLQKPDLSSSSGGGAGRQNEPILAHTADYEVNNLSWAADGHRIAIAYGRNVQILSVGA